MAEREYRRLTRAKNRSQFGIVSTARSSLWLGKDHLLLIDSSGYSESYKRFQFRDIQALVLCRTDTWLYQGVVLFGLAAVFGLLAAFGGPISVWIFGIIGGCFAVFLLLHLLGGPSSKCYLRTAVQTEPLIPLNRWRRARRVFETLRPLILAAQQSVPAQAEATATGPAIPPVISAPELRAIDATVEADPPIRNPA